MRDALHHYDYYVAYLRFDERAALVGGGKNKMVLYNFLNSFEKEQ
jgi:hypothetical protein